MIDQTFGNLNSNLTTNLTSSPAVDAAEPEDLRPTQMRVVLISISGETWSVWLPSKVEGRFRFQDEKGIEADLPFYIEASGKRWIAYSGRGAVFYQERPDSVVPAFIHEVVLTDKMLVRLDYGEEQYLLYSEAQHEGDSIFLPYYFEEDADYLIGRREDCEICYPNATVSRNHAKLHWENNAWSIIDLESTNGVYVNGYRVEAEQRLKNGDSIFIMGLYILVGVGFFSINNADNRIHFNTSKIRRIENERDIAYAMPPKRLPDAQLFDRPPRKMIRIAPEPIEIDMPPIPMSANKIPLLLRLGSPMVMGGRAMVSGNVLMTLTSLILPTLTQSMSETERMDYESKRVDRYYEYLDEKAQEIEDERIQEASLLNQNYPSLTEVLGFPVTKQRLWERRRRDEDFLHIRVGTGEIPMIAEIQYNKRRFQMEPDKLEDEMYALAETPVILQDAPVMLNLQEDRTIGIQGSDEDCMMLFRNLILQIAATHSYDEVKLIVLVDQKQSLALDFVRYFPHCWDDEKTIRFFAVTPTEAQSVSAYLGQHLEEIVSSDDPERLIKDSVRYVVFAQSKRLFDTVEIIKGALQHEKYCGVTVFTAFSGLPKECTKIIDLRAQPQIIDLIHPGDERLPFLLDGYPYAGADNSIRALMRTKLKVGSSLYALPGMITFLEMFGVGRVEHLNPLKRWADNNPVKSLAAPVGYGTDGGLFTLDLHEKRQGPHGLVAGMTGSGKSEFIITYILSMAVNYSPDEVAFILIDYKGGGLADAFEDKARGIHLPHLVGTITNLDGAAIQRSLLSINSELKRRQSVFKQAKSLTGEGTMDIYDYQKMYRAGKVSDPMPHLFIISDEFAELKAQEPEFMDELISAARIGRSLGVHLILATQKPGGVVNNQIWSNTKFRVCLKVQDRSDSMEMLKRPEAAELKQTGRFYLQVGYNEYFALGQSAWCGAPYIPQDEVTVEVDDSVQFIDHVGQEILRVKPKKEQKPAEGKQIVAMVQYLSNLAKREKVGAKALWMEPLPAVLDYETLAATAPRPQGTGCYALIGMIDDPERQDQHPYWLDVLSFRNMMLCGNSGSGKSTYLKTMLYSLISNYSPEQVNYYLLDLSNGVLGGFAKAPHCGVYLTEEDDEDVPRMFQLMTDMISRRKRLFAEAEVDSYEAYRSIHPLPLVLVIIDGFTNFPGLSCGETYYAKLQEYLREGSNYGIRYILSVNHTNEISSRAKMEIDISVAVQAKDRFEYGDILDAKCNRTPPVVNGRGMCLEEERPLEYHTALLDSTLAEQERSAALRRRINALQQRYSDIHVTEHLPMMDLEEPFLEFCSKFAPERLPLGYDVREIKPVSLPFQQWHSISMFFGNPKGVSPVIKNLLIAAQQNGMEVILVQRKTGSAVDELTADGNLSGVFPCVSSVLPSTEESLSSLADRILDEIVSRNVLRDAYCEQKGIPSTATGRSRKAAKYIRANSKPLFVLIESFADFCAAEQDEEIEGKFTVFFDQMFGYNIYFAAGFYPDDDSRITIHKLMKAYNRAELMLLFGGRYNKLPMASIPYQLSKIDRVDPKLNQFIMKYQMEYYPLAMPDVHEVKQEEDPDDAPII